MSQQDLRGIRDVLAANHPGPVDPDNPAYSDWLNRGLLLAEERAQSARTYGDYVRSLRFYTNGFRDGHIGLEFALNTAQVSWPGFLIRHESSLGRMVVGSSTSSDIPVGAEIIECDDRPVKSLLAERVEPFFWNRDLPHTRWSNSWRLMMVQPDDRELKLKSCSFHVDGKRTDVQLTWVNSAPSTVGEHVSNMTPSRPALGLRKSGALWIVGLPSFAYAGEAAEPIRALIEEIKQRAPELRRGTVVLDVRGNGGGNSAWGHQVAAAIWSEELVERVARSFDWTVDWRVSPANIAHLERVAAQNERDGLAEAAAAWAGGAEAMRAAHERGEALVRVSNPPSVFTSPSPDNPVTGRVFLLTDERCASACLDFVDVVRGLPRTKHIGFPTYADAVYIDNTSALLPSGLASLSYSLKVYRNRIRGNNEWYAPEIAWPGGDMTEEALTRWIAELP